MIVLPLARPCTCRKLDTPHREWQIIVHFKTKSTLHIDQYDKAEEDAAKGGCFIGQSGVDLSYWVLKLPFIGQKLPISNK